MTRRQHRGKSLRSSRLARATVLRACVVLLVAALVAEGLLEGSPAAADSRQVGAVQQALQQAREQRFQIEQRMQATQRRIEGLYARQAELEVEREQFADELALREAEFHALTERTGLRLRQTYMFGSAVDPVAVFFASDDPSGALAKAETIRWLVAGDRARADELSAVRVRAASAQELLDARIAELDRVTSELAVLTRALEDDLARAQRLEASLDQQVRDELRRIDAERRAALAAESAATSTPANATQPSGPASPLVCPIDQPHSFIDSWGHPRSGGRRHRGTDLMAPNGLPLRAITDGVWEHRTPGRSAGIWGVLRGDDGTTYRYMHLSAHSVPSGARVVAGDQVGRNGSTGNASTPHLHFEVHPGGGSAINPYPLLRTLCG